jgi:hypothetical protein
MAVSSWPRSPSVALYSDPEIKTMSWVTAEKDMTVSQQCELAGVSRATMYAQRKPQFVCVVELQLCRLIDEDTRAGRSTAAARWCVFS